MTISFDSLKFGDESYRNPFLVKGHICKSDKPRYYKRDNKGRFSRVNAPSKREKKNLFKVKPIPSEDGGLGDSDTGIDLYKPKTNKFHDREHMGELYAYDQAKDPTGRKYSEVSWVNVGEDHRRQGVGSQMIKMWEDINNRKIVHSTSLSHWGRKFAAGEGHKRLISIVDSKGNEGPREHQYVVTQSEYEQLHDMIAEQNERYNKLRDEYYDKVYSTVRNAQYRSQKPARDYLHGERNNSIPKPKSVNPEPELKKTLADLSRQLDDFDTFIAARATHFNAGRSNPITPEQAQKYSYVPDWKQQYPELLDQDTSRWNDKLADSMLRQAKDIKRNRGKKQAKRFVSNDYKDDYALAKNDHKLRDVALASGGALAGLGVGLGSAEAYKRHKIKQIKGRAIKGSKIAGGAALLAGGAVVARKATKKPRIKNGHTDDNLAYDLIRGGMGVQKNWKQEIAKNTWI